MKNLISILSLFFITFNAYAQWEIIQIDETGIDFYHHIDFRDSLNGLILTYDASNTLKTIDGGDTWEVIETEGFSILDFEYLAGDTIVGLGKTEDTYHLYWSYDDGTSWQEGLEISGGNLSTLLKYNELLWIGSYGKIYRSTEIGNSFEEVFTVDSIGYTFGDVSNIFQTSDSIIYAAGHGREEEDNTFKYFILKSINQGNNWEIINSQEDFSFYSPTMHFWNDSVGFYISNNYAVFGSIKHSTTDGGNTWTTENIEAYGPFDISFPSDSVGYFVTGNTLYGTEFTSSLFSIAKSTDSGEIWDNQFLNEDGIPLHSVHFITDSIGFAVGESGLILKTVTCGGEMDEDYPFPPNATTAIEQNHQVKLYPNPTGSPQIQIELLEKLSKHTTLHLFNAIGQEINKVKLTRQTQTLVLPYRGVFYYKIITDYQIIDSGMIERL